MTGYRRKTVTAVPKERFPHSVKIQVLISAECEAFFPADVFFTDNVVHLRYSTGNYKSLKSCETMNTVQALDLVKTVIRLRTEAQDWLWFPEEYVLSADTVWINPQGKIRMLCIPDGRRIAGNQRMNGFLYDLKKLSEPAASSWLQILQEIVLSGSEETEQLIGEIDLLTAEVQSYL